ncbi:hypothetical protein [Rhizobium sp. Root483D2]|uniref:hypothetical protein n=1 Tax=Rhizobium sp. Root483D2 TaxID=1736545 RepID=UPI00244EAE4B|nr:hypothetical protein [Rhizobium sp. Root483D2]
MTGALPKALTSYGIYTRTIMPGYAGTLEKLVDVRNEADVELLGETARFYSGRHDGMAVIIVTARFSSTAMAAPIWIAKERTTVTTGDALPPCRLRRHRSPRMALVVGGRTSCT